MLFLKTDDSCGVIRMIDDSVDEKSDIRHEFAHLYRIRSLDDGPLQDVGFSDALQQGIEIDAVRDQTGFVQVPSATITRRVIVLVPSRLFVPQHEAVTQIDFERVILLLEHA